MSVSENLSNVLASIREVEAAHGREPGSVKLVAVSKTKPVDLIAEVLAEGQLDLGENRVQEMTLKQPQLPGARWHLIGQLQRNKVKYIAEFVHLIHSVDSEKLVAEIDKQARKHERVIDCLLQINISDEEQKSGLNEVEAKTLLMHMTEYPNVRIIGLMGMAEHTDDMEVVGAQFRRLREARDRFAMIRVPGVEIRELSMGMTHDYEVAIKEGATMLRIGSAVFGVR